MELLEEEKRKLEESTSPARVSELEGELKRERKCKVCGGCNVSRRCRVIMR